jgi:hypothetical protein
VKKQPAYASEVALCAAFLAAVDKQKWTAYAESLGWDILLVRNRDGFQIGIQAKLRLNVEVINQAIEEGAWYRIDEPGPDCRAILVPPDGGPAFDKVCDFIGLTIIRMRDMTHLNPRWNSAFMPSLPDDQIHDREWHEMAPTKRHKLPEYIPDVAAGSSAPIQLTQWKIKAIKIAILLESRGYVTRADFSYLQIDHRRWITMGWLKIENGRYVANASPDFKAQHPIVYGQIESDVEKWKPKQSEML